MFIFLQLQHFLITTLGQQWYYSTKNKPVEVTHMYYRGDRYVYKATIQLDENDREWDEKSDGIGKEKEGKIFYKKDDLGYKGPVEGVKLKTLTYGEKTLMAEFRLKKRSTLPEHSHPHEQIGYLVSGRIVLIIDGQRKPAEPGDSWCIHGDVLHSGETVEDSVVIEVFSQVREDFLP